MKLRLPLVAWPARRPAFASPVSAGARTVILEPLFRPRSDILFVDPLEPEAVSRMRAFRPAAIAGRLKAILDLAGSIAPTHALVIFTREGTRCLLAADRDRLWDAFGVPVFEQVIDSDGRLIAWECDAHDGLHLAAAATRAAGSLDESVCDCGLAVARLMNDSTAPSLAALAGERLPLVPARLASRSRPIPT